MKLLAISTKLNVLLSRNLLPKDEQESKKENRFGKSTHKERIPNLLKTPERFDCEGRIVKVKLKR